MPKPNRYLCVLLESLFLGASIVIGGLVPHGLLLCKAACRFKSQIQKFVRNHYGCHYHQ